MSTDRSASAIEKLMDLSRCDWCGWPLDPEGKMCRADDCSMRPRPTRDDTELRQAVRALTARVADLDMMLHWLCRAHINSYGNRNGRGLQFCPSFAGRPDELWAWVDTSDGTSLSGGQEKRTIARIRVVDGLPLLTAEARAALQERADGK